MIQETKDSVLRDQSHVTVALTLCTTLLIAQSVQENEAHCEPKTSRPSSVKSLCIQDIHELYQPGHRQTFFDDAEEFPVSVSDGFGNTNLSFLRAYFEYIEPQYRILDTPRSQIVAIRVAPKQSPPADSMRG
jgi:hypothetical protein